MLDFEDQNQICTVCIMERYLAFGEDTHTLRLTSELVDLRVGYAKWIRLRRAASNGAP